MKLRPASRSYFLVGVVQLRIKVTTWVTDL